MNYQPDRLDLNTPFVDAENQEIVDHLGEDGPSEAPGKCPRPTLDHLLTQWAEQDTQFPVKTLVATMKFSRLPVAKLYPV